jgi:spore photoproduct lyase family protein
MGNSGLLNIQKVYVEQRAREECESYVNHILSRFPGAKEISVPSHWQIPELNLDPEQTDDWFRNKREILVIGMKKGLACRENGRSTDFIAPSQSNGCTLGCSYCYVNRRKGYANPITVFANIGEIVSAIWHHAKKLGPKQEPNQCDPMLWTYDIGENCDCSVDDLVSPNVKELINRFAKHPTAKLSFATKYVNPQLLTYDPQGKTRIRFSLMPAHTSRVVDVRTSSILDRINAINDFVEAGYEVHLNFSPVIVYDGWKNDYIELFQQVSSVVTEKTWKQIKAEVIFLTHNAAQHELNMRWHPKGEDLIWRPDIQEEKFSGNRMLNVRYRRELKHEMVHWFRQALNQHLGIPVRYAF